MTVGAMNTLIRRYPDADPHPPTGTTPTCTPCTQNDCRRCTAHTDTRRIIAGQPAAHPACLHPCLPTRPLTPREHKRQAQPT